jgi:hypothetical protein
MWSNRSRQLVEAHFPYCRIVLALRLSCSVDSKYARWSNSSPLSSASVGQIVSLAVENSHQGFAIWRWCGRCVTSRGVIEARKGLQIVYRCKPLVAYICRSESKICPLLLSFLGCFGFVSGHCRYSVICLPYFFSCCRLPFKIAEYLKAVRIVHATCRPLHRASWMNPTIS